MKSINASIALAMFFVALLGIAAFIHADRQYLRINGDVYEMVGVAALNDKGTDLYIPVFRRK